MQAKTKIFINTLPVHNATGGMKTFLLELLHALAARNNEKFEYCLICSPSNENIFDKIILYKNFSRITVAVNSLNIFLRVYFEQFRMNKLLKGEKNAILLNICNVAVLRCSAPQVTILQAPLSIASLRKTLPEKYVFISRFHKMYYDFFVMRSLKISEKTIAVSEFMLQFLKKYKDKVAVVHEGVNLEQFIQQQSTRNEPTEPYILSVSTLFPYKNMNNVITAFSFFKKKGFKHKLFIAGRDPDGKQLDILKQLAQSLGIAEDVNFIGLVPYTKVATLYKNASLFLFLSSVETFGLPVLEAMMSGVPVIASNAMSVPEIAGDAGIIVNPNDEESIAMKMEEIITNASLRNSMIEKGIDNVKRFNWNNTAEKFEKIFEDVSKKFQKNNF